MGSVLDEVASAADEVGDDQRRIARRVRQMKHRRDSGWSWARIMDSDGDPGIFELLRQSARRLSGARLRLAQGIAAGLSGEGETRRQIGRRLAVSHQRVTAMLKGDRPPPDCGPVAHPKR